MTDKNLVGEEKHDNKVMGAQKYDEGEGRKKIHI